MPDREIDKLRNLTKPEIPMQVTLKEALDILKERTFQLRLGDGDPEIFHLADKISEYIYPSDPED